MKRAIITPADVAGAALSELKDWLAITSGRDDTPLATLLSGALDLFEAFTAQMPLEQTCEEVLPATGAWQKLKTRPVQAITGLEGIPAEGARFALAATDYEVDLDADGSARVRVIRQGSAGRIAVRFTAGIAPQWAALPPAIRDGVIRFAAHGYRQRDLDGNSAANIPPAAVAALWQPWRILRLA
ncbi:MAG: hypothetical protein R3E21_05695 [Caenibius sp.]